MYKRYETLLKLVEKKGLGFALTNEWSNSKPHFLAMRKEGLVVYTDGKDSRIQKFNSYFPYGAEINGLWYTISFKGLGLLRELFPENEKVKDVILELFIGIFNDDEKYKKEINYRK